MRSLTDLVRSCRGKLVRGLGAVVLLLVAGLQPAWATPSACTAMWGVNSVSTSSGDLSYWNGTNWTVVGNTGIANSINALGGYASDGALYYASKVASPANLHRATFNNASGTITFSSSLGQIGTPTTGSFLTYTTTASVSKQWTTTAYSFVGGTFLRDANRRMLILATQVANATEIPTSTGAVQTLAAIGLLDPEAPTVVSWQLLKETQGAGTVTYPNIGNSGDIFSDQQTGQVWVISNTNPNRLYKINVDYSGTTLNSVIVTSTSTIQVGGSNIGGAQQGIAVDPLTGNVYTAGGPATTTGFILSADFLAGGSTLAQTNVGSGTGVGDSGNCVDKPDPPTVSKSFSPTFRATSAVAVTTTATVTINNPNKVPIWLNAATLDLIPQDLKVNTSQVPVVQCFSNGVSSTTPTSTTFSVASSLIGPTTMTIAAGSMIPGGSTSGGSCSFAVSLTTTTAGFYINTVNAGSISSTVGVNAAAATANFNFATTDFSVTKYQRLGSTGATTTSALTAGASTTVNYIITFYNAASSSSTQSVTFTDSMPSALTYTGGASALTSAITTATFGAGSLGGCTATTAAINAGGVGLRITGTVTNAAPDGGCQLTIPVLASNTAVTNAINTVTFAGLGYVDSNLTNNTATVTLDIIAATTKITITKTDARTSVSASGTTAYTITVANLGPSNAPNTVVKDTPGTGLVCSTVSCSTSSGTCPTAGSTTMAYLNSSTGITLSTFSVGHTLDFVVSCNVTATGQ